MSGRLGLTVGEIRRGGLSIHQSLGARLDLTDDEEEQVAALIAQIHRASEVRGLHMKSFFERFDKQRHGVVTVPQFHRGLQDAFSGTLSEDERGLLARAFTYGEGTAARVSYREFHQSVGVALDGLSTGAGQSAEEAAATARMRATALGGRAAGGGEGAASHKRGALSLTSVSIGASGGTGLGGDAQTKEEMAEIHRAAGLGGEATAMDLVMRHASERRVRVSEQFIDFDPLRKGLCTRSQFLRGLTNLRFTGVGPSEREEIADAYEADATRGTAPMGGAYVDFRSFAEDVEEAFGTVRGLEAHPTAPEETRARALAKTGGAVPGRREVPEEMRPVLDRAVRRIEDQVRKRGIEMVQAFKDFDRAHEEHVTIDQFLRVLRMLSLYPEDPAEREALVTRYRGLGTRHRMVWWRGLKDDTDPPEVVDVTAKALRDAEAAATARKAIESSVRRGADGGGDRRRADAAMGAGVPGGGSAVMGGGLVRRADAAEVMLVIKRAAALHGLRVGDFLAEHDRLRRGRITPQQLQTSLTAAGLRFSEAQNRALFAAYGRSELGLDAAGRPMIDRWGFEADANAGIGVHGLEKDPDRDADAEMRAAMEGAAETLRGRVVVAET